MKKTTKTKTTIELESLGHGSSAPALVIVNGQRVGRPLPPKVAGGVRSWLQAALPEIIEAAVAPAYDGPTGPVKAAPYVPPHFQVDRGAVELGASLLADYRRRFHGGRGPAKPPGEDPPSSEEAPPEELSTTAGGEK